ncbi:hypothetical protein SAT01_30250 [Sinomonas atrocyanea]|jgi:hypothetical protein|uniref:DUF3073 domain-containing protein n=1 Tax=Sinomonas atrocyanea TaxID=37927 RepID=UPI00082E9588|nr:DUF3073 domain-containing protein [Sinomonas atrocyanea]MDP9884882.1 hypothetical protein [Sinomonas atrocyanea]GEB65577.1 hypothetical protein SAT01_30250 [Sinomonas atrocyanea]GGG78101.1 hypothetical protein GCM10007172_33920 [Sinomonas atrocyanea]
MGRGRQKAKATKQARDIKYYSPSTDYAALERELGSQGGHSSHRYADNPEPDYSDYEDKYADQFADEDEDEDSRRIG